jgi:hypothetical protein
MGRLLAGILLALFVAVNARAARLEVCVFSFNRPDEVEVFKARQAEGDFEVVDLSPHLPSSPAAAPGRDDGAGPAPWLSNVCRSDLRCDVVVYSAEFAGRFFGTSGTSVGQQEMEEASCQPRCEGIFHHPREVFLLGCNTLATKDQDRRTPGEYLNVLMDHGFDRATAERVVALRYGPLGPSFREAHRRIFMGVGRIYGFASVAPTGERTAPLLEHYLRAKGDYGRYLDRLQGDAEPNRELLTAFRGTALVQTAGLSRSEPAAADRAKICDLYDDTQSVAQRLRIVQQLLDRPDLLAFLPTIEMFVRRHPAQQMKGEEQRLFADIQRRDAARDQVLRLVHDLNVSALKMELAHLALQLNWMAPQEFRQLAVAGARQLLGQPLTSEVVDIMCEISKQAAIGDEFASEALPERLFKDAEGIRLLDCLSPPDKRVSARLVPGLDSPDVSVRLWAGYALSRRLPLDDGILVSLAAHLGDPATGLHERLRWIFEAQGRTSDAVRRAVGAHDPQLAEDMRGRRTSRRQATNPSS